MGLLLVRSFTNATVMLECANQVLVTNTRLTGKTAPRSIIAPSIMSMIPQRQTLWKSILHTRCQQGISVIMGDIDEETSCAECVC